MLQLLGTKELQWLCKHMIILVPTPVKLAVTELWSWLILACETKSLAFV